MTFVASGAGIAAGTGATLAAGSELAAIGATAAGGAAGGAAAGGASAAAAAGIGAGTAAGGAGAAGGSQILSKLLSKPGGGGATGGNSDILGKLTGALNNKGLGAIERTAFGFLQSLKARRAKKQAEALMPGASDPTQLAFLAEMNQKRRALNTGSEFAADMGYLKQAAAGTNQAIVQAGGGDVAGTMQALLGSQANVGRSMNQVLARADEQQKFYNTFTSDLTNKIAQRRMEIALSKSLQERAEWAQGAQDSYANISNAAARGMGVSDWADMLKRNPGKSPITPPPITPPPSTPPPSTPPQSYIPLAPGISEELPGPPAIGQMPNKKIDF